MYCELDVVTDGNRRTSQRLISAVCVYQSQGLLIPVSKYYSTEVLQLFMDLHIAEPACMEARVACYTCTV